MNNHPNKEDIIKMCCNEQLKLFLNCKYKRKIIYEDESSSCDKLLNIYIKSCTAYYTRVISN